MPLVEEIVELLGPRAQEKGHRDRLRHRRAAAGHGDGRSIAAAPGAAQPGGQRDQVHRRAAASASWSSAARRRTKSRSRCATPASASLPDQQARIFLEFEQADEGSGRKFGGSGLGLAISRRIVERWAAASPWKARPGAARRSAFAVPLPRSGTAPAFEPPDLAGLSRDDRRIAFDRSVHAGAPAGAMGRGGVACGGAPGIGERRRNRRPRIKRRNGRSAAIDRRRDASRDASSWSRRASGTACWRSAPPAPPAIW